ncbi:siderophore-interacting protein [Streptomyces sp. 8L]|uniref:siderophore-interacting protein n=1 Tax=Streptomyces sp. 8L TaxID=2877242 RepID=UPI001CD4B212|nr:siderophore-interacting protein [Streptomyces sp. 8L]MCA1219623.1 siderophore-interacting protein [Streptomyces sp. 8L]
MTKTSRLMPKQPGLFRGEVVRSVRLSPSIQRVTVTGAGFGGFPWQGYDHWFRLFHRRPHQERFVLPELTGDTWWKSYLAIPEGERPHCANYTVAGFRPGAAEMDIDFVVHCDPSGEPAGAAAIWACATRPGDPMALLDQGIIFDCPGDATEVVVVADESGLPATAGILRSLPRDTVGRVIQEIPTAGDRRALDAPDGVRVTWVVRDDPGAVPGAAALEELRGHQDFDGSGYAFVVGESTLATEGRRHVHRSGLPKERITFSGFWKHDRAKAAAVVA